MRRATPGTPLNDIEETAQKRFDKAKAIYRIYIENIHLFDHVILNVADFKYTHKQIEHIVNNIKSATKELKG